MRMLFSSITATFLGLASPVGRCADVAVHNATYGFSVVAPTFPKQTDSGISVTPVTFSGPLHDGKAPSCNVQIQNMGQSLSDFRTQSLGQFKALGITLESETQRKVSGKDALLLVSSGHDLKFLSLAVPIGSSMYLVTCIAPADQFSTYEQTFRGVIDSFSLD